MASKRPIPSFLIFQDKNQHWRWNYLAANGRIVAIGAEAYLRPQGCLKAIRLLQESTSIPILVRQVRPAEEAAPALNEAQNDADAPLQLNKAQIIADG